MKTLYWVWRRDLAVMLRAPIVYVVGGLFLVVQGLAFAALVGQLSDPQRPAPLGALLEGQLAGTLLTWVLQLVVLTLLGMRAIADERRSGGWELLLTARVSERAAVVGKWLAAVTVYALLWLPTLAYLAVVAWFRAGGGWDVATIVCGYAGAIALGAALLAWTVAASAATSTTLAAGGLGFAALIGIFLVGELPSVAPTLAIDHPMVAHVLDAVSLRGQLTSLARGELSLPALVLIVGLAITGLSLAIALACAGRRRPREVRARFAATGLVAVIAVLAGALAARHPGRVDVSASHRNTLATATRAALASLHAPATITIVQPTLGALASLYAEVGHVADHMADISPIAVRRLDPASLPGGLAAAAREAAVPEDDLAKSGAVIVEVAGRRRVVDVFDLATIDLAPGATPKIEQLAIEQALSGALLALTDDRPVRACATTGHGELSVDTAAPGGVDWTAIGARLRGEGIAIASGVDASCDVVIVAGPTTPLSPDDALALQALVQAGRGLVVAASSPASGELPATGLEGLLATDGIGLPPALAVDPALAVRSLPGALLMTTGFAAHPVNAGFVGERALLWRRPRVVSGGAPLVTATASSWGERDLASDVVSKDPDDLAGPVVLAAEGRHHTIVIGSAESFDTAALARAGTGNAMWLVRAIRYAASKLPPSPVGGTRAPDSIRLVLTDRQRSWIVGLCTAGIPLLWILLGGGLVEWRRRRAR